MKIIAKQLIDWLDLIFCQADIDFSDRQEGIWN